MRSSLRSASLLLALNSIRFALEDHMFPLEHQLRVAYLDVVSGMAFQSSVEYWRRKSDSEKRWVKINSQTKPMLIGKYDALEVDGNAMAEISAPEGGIIHINGNVNSNIELGGHSEVIVRGDLASTSTMNVSGISHMYVGGSVRGRIVSTGTLAIWIDGDFIGSLETGNPSTNLHVRGDLTGRITPFEDAALLWLVVNGHASDELISNISMLGYTQFNAAIDHSDVEPGLYPKGPGSRKTDSGNSHTRWSVLNRG